MKYIKYLILIFVALMLMGFTYGCYEGNKKAQILKDRERQSEWVKVQIELNKSAKDTLIVE